MGKVPAGYRTGPPTGGEVTSPIHQDDEPYGELGGDCGFPGGMGSGFGGGTGEGGMGCGGRGSTADAMIISE